MKSIKNKITSKYIDIYNKIVMKFYGKRWSIVLINEYPKCGGTWLRQMLSNYCNIDTGNGNNNKHGVMQKISKNAILQRHCLLNKKKAFYKIIIIIRDPRDSYNSFFFHENYLAVNIENQKKYGYNEKANEKVNMYNYLYSKLFYPELTQPGFSYSQFWEANKFIENIYIVKYEDLKDNPKDELVKILNYLTIDICEKRIEEIIETFSFKNQTKRNTGEEDKFSHTRKGVVGDWKNNFHQESERIVKEKLGKLIEELGYKW